ncbi:WD40 repeat-like protein [Sistotremastrum suecicum HHB10207 ss-3]|uniref:WD40 repeat-like protein n=1 Tax=Sistotremastrum suecicum HHB10207 ss-3 TaxID=1314776 RepID=A0A166BRN8_9AGAM|nr:WD40 repeat-like protein [Sistotremastrum suecicum HHB10207 ss-3]
MSKRPGTPPGVSTALTKRAREDSPAGPQQQLIAISSGNDDKQKGLIRTVKRTSSLEAPIVSLAGAHGGEILSCRFDPTGQNIAACSTDRCVSLWRTYPPTTNYGFLTNVHKTAITDLQWSLTSSQLYTVGADGLLIMTDLTTGTRSRKIRAHRGVINSLDRTIAGAAGVELLATGGDDGFLKIWEESDEGKKAPVATYDFGCPVTSVCWSADGTHVFVGALDNEIHIFDLRKGELWKESLGGHTDTPTSLSLSPNGQFLLSPSLSSQTIIHDVRPFAPNPTRIHRVLTGVSAGFENALLRGAWSKDDGGRRVAVGGSDRTVTIWDVESGRILYKLPGHKGTVMAVDFHPKEPIVLTGSKDYTMLLGEIEPGIGI